jgi:DNA-binding PadR family transcriptional regulator
MCRVYPGTYRRRVEMIGHDLTAAPAAPLVLTILLGGDRSGYEIVGRVRELSEGSLGWPDSMAYPLFHRLRRLGYITADWRDLPEGTRRRVYAITEDGRAALTRFRRKSMAALMAFGFMFRGFGWLRAT